jgi:hypothetical protein
MLPSATAVRADDARDVAARRELVAHDRETGVEIEQFAPLNLFGKKPWAQEVQFPAEIIAIGLAHTADGGLPLGDPSGAENLTKRQCLTPARLTIVPRGCWCPGDIIGSRQLSATSSART